MQKMARKGIIADDSKILRFVDSILAIGFHIAKDLPPGTFSRAWIAKYLKMAENFV